MPFRLTRLQLKHLSFALFATAALIALFAALDAGRFVVHQFVVKEQCTLVGTVETNLRGSLTAATRYDCGFFGYVDVDLRAG